MKTTQGKALRAYVAINELMPLPFRLQDALGLMKIKKALELVFEFQANEEQKLVEEYRPDIRDGRYVFECNDPDYMEMVHEFQNRLNEIGRLEIDLDVQPVTLSVSGNSNIQLKPETLLALDGIVSFE